MKIGVISDTHGYLDPRVNDLFAEVDHILHAGDVGRPTIVFELEKLAPVTVVVGNVDGALHYRETEVVELGGRKFMVHHIVDVNQLSEVVLRRLDHDRPDVLVFGHTHKPYSAQVGSTLFFNPGYAGKPRFALPHSVAILHLEAGQLRAEYLPLD